MVRTFLLLGSNEGDRKAYIEKACHSIEAGAGKIIAISSLYQTAAWGKEDQPAFLNQVIIIDTDMSPEDLLKTILAIESKFGRSRLEKWGSRTLDMDILFYGDQIISTKDLIVPHPAIAQRRFTLIPLAELAPDFVHPVLRKNMKQLLLECIDMLEVEKFKSEVEN